MQNVQQNVLNSNLKDTFVWEEDLAQPGVNLQNIIGLTKTECGIKVTTNLYPVKFTFDIFGDLQRISFHQLIMQFSNQFISGREFQFKCSGQLCGFL